MELIKDIAKQFYPLLIMLACVLFVVGVYFSADMFGGTGVFEGTGEVFEPMLVSDELKNDGLSYVGSTSSGYTPVVKYISVAHAVGESVTFKDMFTVRKEDGTTVSGSTEDGFAIYLIDIKSLSGNSMLEVLSTEEIAGLEEIPAAFIYDKELDTLYFHGSGTYMVYVKVYGPDGGQTTYEFKLPVETS